MGVLDSYPTGAPWASMTDMPVQMTLLVGACHRDSKLLVLPPWRGGASGRDLPRCSAPSAVSLPLVISSRHQLTRAALGDHQHTPVELHEGRPVPHADERDIMLLQRPIHLHRRGRRGLYIAYPNEPTERSLNVFNMRLH